MKQQKRPTPELQTGLYRIVIRCNDEELKYLNKQCRKYNLTRAGFIKKKAFDVPLSIIPMENKSLDETI
jgi:hypothetical protein